MVARFHRPLVVAVLLATAVGVRPAAAQEADDRPLPAYTLPDGLSGTGPATPALEMAIARAVQAVTRPSTPDAAREGWRVLAGIGSAGAPSIVAELGRADWFGRALLVRSLGSMGDARLNPLLVEASRDPAWAVREAAAEGLGLAGGPATAAALAPLLADPSWRVRRAALGAIRRRILRGSMPLAPVAEPLRRLGDDPDLDVRRDAWLALADLRHPGARDRLLAALDAVLETLGLYPDGTGEEEAFAVALRLLRGLSDGWGDDPGMRECLRDLARDETGAIAGFALREWFRLGGPEAAADGPAVALLVSLFVNPQAESRSRTAAERALVELGEPAAAALEEHIRQRGHATRMARPAENSREQIELLVRLRGDRAPDTLATLLRDENVRHNVRVLAAEIGRRVAAVELGPVFLELLRIGDDRHGLAAQLIKGIAAANVPEARALLARALVLGDDGRPPSQVRVAAAEVLLRRPDLRDRDAVFRAIERENDGDALARLLGILRADAGDEALAVLLPFLDDGRVRVRLAAVGAFADVPGPEAVAALLEQLDREDGVDDRAPYFADGLTPEEKEQELAAIAEANAARVRTAIVAALRFAAGDGAPAMLADLLAHPDPVVRQAAASNLVSAAEPATVPAIAARIDVETLAGLRPMLLAAAATAGGDAATRLFEDLLAGDDAERRLDALAALQSSTSRVRAPAGVRRSLERDDAAPGERFEAIAVLGLSASPESTPLLLELLADARDDDERRQVIQSLGHTRDPNAVAPLTALLPRRGLAGVEAQALATVVTTVEAIGELRSPAAAPPLVHLLRDSLPRALAGRAADVQLSRVTLRALGRAGGDEARAALAAAAFHPGFSRAADLATAAADHVRAPGEQAVAVVPRTLRELGLDLADALTREKDATLAPRLRRRLEELATDGRAQALSEAWLSWLGRAVGGMSSMDDRRPNRPRWNARMALAEQVLANAPRASAFDREARRLLFIDAVEVRGDDAAAAGHLTAWRRLWREQDPFEADRARDMLDGLERLVGALAAGPTAERATADRVEAALALEPRDPEALRVGATALRNRRLHLDVAEGLAAAAVEHASSMDTRYPLLLRTWGSIRTRRGNPSGALDKLREALQEMDARQRGSHPSAWYRFELGKAYALLGAADRAARLIAGAMRLNDTVRDWVAWDPALADLRDSGALDAGFTRAAEVFDEVPPDPRRDPEPEPLEDDADR